MVKISSTFTRPSVSVPWHMEVVDMSAVNALAGSPAWADKHQVRTNEEIMGSGANDTTMTAFVIWSSQADYEAYKATPEWQAYAAARDAYNAANGITQTPETVTTV